MNRMRQIDWLIETHKGDYLNCTRSSCPKCQQIQRLRELEEQEREFKYKRILSKGRRITKDEVVYLLIKGYDKKTIREVMGFSQKSFDKLLKRWGVSEMVKSGEIELATASVLDDTTIELLKQYLAEKRSQSEIGRMFGVTKLTVQNWIKKLDLKKVSG